MEWFDTIIYVDSTCQRHCPNCYYRKDNGTLMTKETGKKLAEWIVAVYTDIKPKNLLNAWLGGEPLLNLDVLLSINDYIEKNRPKEIRWGENGLFTNGDLLTEEILKELKQRKIRVRVNPTYDSLKDISDKIDLVQSVCHGCSLSIVLDELNLERLPELTELCMKKYCHMRINKLYDGAAIPGYVERYAEQMDKMLDIILKEPIPIWPNMLMESTTVLWPGPKNPNFCGKYLAVIDPNGDIRSCNPDMGTKVGNIETHKFQDLKFAYNRWSAKNIPECQGCEWVLWCQGGCPYSTKLTYGTYERKSPFCEAFKKLFPKVMQVRDKWVETH